MRRMSAANYSLWSFGFADRLLNKEAMKKLA